MKFLLEFVTCCGPCSSEARRPAEETSLLVVEEPRRRVVRKRGRIRGGSRAWQPSLSSISEETASSTAERIKNGERPAARWRIKMPSMPPRRNRVSSNLDPHDFRRAPFSNISPAFPAPIMF